MHMLKAISVQSSKPLDAAVVTTAALVRPEVGWNSAADAAGMYLDSTKSVHIDEDPPCPLYPELV